MDHNKNTTGEISDVELSLQMTEKEIMEAKELFDRLSTRIASVLSAPSEGLGCEAASPYPASKCSLSGEIDRLRRAVSGLRDHVDDTLVRLQL